MMKLSTIATALILSSGEAYAAPRVVETTKRRMRSAKLYSSTPQRDVEFGIDIVDPFIGLPDEREQRGLEELSMSTTSVTSLEMSMPTAASMTNQMSFSYPLQGPPTSTGEDAAVATNSVVAAAEGAPNSALMTAHSSVVAVATVVSAIAGVVVALV
jgi:hypothetical protein